MGNNSSVRHFPVAAILFGLGITLLGFWMLGDALSWLNLGNLLDKFWPIIFFFVGLFLASSPMKEARIIGGGLIAVSILSIMRRLDLFDTAFGRTLLAILVIVTGIVLMLAVAGQYSRNAQKPK